MSQCAVIRAIPTLFSAVMLSGAKHLWLSLIALAVQIARDSSPAAAGSE